MVEEVRGQQREEQRVAQLVGRRGFRVVRLRVRARVRVRARARARGRGRGRARVIP